MDDLASLAQALDDDMDVVMEEDIVLEKSEKGLSEVRAKPNQFDSSTVPFSRAMMIITTIT